MYVFFLEIAGLLRSNSLEKSFFSSATLATLHCRLVFKKFFSLLLQHFGRICSKH